VYTVLLKIRCQRIRRTWCQRIRRTFIWCQRIRRTWCQRIRRTWCQRIRRTWGASESAGLRVPANPQDLFCVCLPANPQDLCQRKRRTYGASENAGLMVLMVNDLTHGLSLTFDSGPPGSMADLALLAPWLVWPFWLHIGIKSAQWPSWLYSWSGPPD